ncbi:hypothetical protein EDD18DRAFT_1434106 [Armillaria luteobubalina]|uniref:Uncharacterized protein n=1 Tax=Armillaria luteobubalina TaxID=153913 RepID=A0AA39US15_9AGAR|nr:hypothetical protein EDD18DRAFT_1434106 [Armillaria luteobubalina]
MNRLVSVIDLPVGNTPGWEVEKQDGDEDLKSVSESFVLCQSLRQSRDRWLSFFPKFSSRSRGGKTSDISPPAHTIQSRGRCDLEVGPHIFPGTTFSEVHYLSSQPTSQVPQSYQPYQSTSSGNNSSWTSYGNSYSTNAPQASPQPNESQSSAPLLSSLSSVTIITPALIHQVNSAASSNPTLANLLQLAAAGKASPDQLQTLGLLIQSLAHSPAVMSQNAISSPSYPPAPTKEFDLVFEFQETSSERWILPRGPALCERKIDSSVTDAAYDIIITTCLAPTSDSTVAATPVEEKAEVVTFRLIKAPLPVWDVVSRWVGGEEKMKESRVILDQLMKNRPPRSYLGLQLSPGSLLTQLQNAEHISIRDERKPSTVTTPAVPATLSSLQGIHPNPLLSASSTAPSVPAPSSASTPAPVSVPAPAPTSLPAPALQPKPPKRPRVTTPRPVAQLPQIRCMSCGQTDVPLILGGRFCRPCVDGGKANLEIPSVRYPVQSRSYYPTAHYPQSIHPPQPFVPPSSSAYRASPLGTNHVVSPNTTISPVQHEPQESKN